jgi:transcriptional regulator with XRE-family HTH domain
MGRKRATFREGIGDAERQYAQALRDIRDHRGETQQELGRLLGWSVSTVSRFEAATERPDRATHQRYLALAPTEELRQRAAAAYEALPPDGSTQHPEVVRRSPEEWHGRALDGPGVYRLLEATYPAYPLLRLFGDEAKPLPVWPTAGTAAVRPDSDGGHELGRRVRARSSAGMLRPMAQLSVSRPDRCCPWGTVRDRCYGHAEGTAGEDNPARA